MIEDSPVKEKLNPLTSPSLKNWGDAPQLEPSSQKNVTVECGWGRLVFAHTFATNTDIAAIMSDEKAGYRDLALYLRDPHVVVAKAPQELFIDPSYTYRLPLEKYQPKQGESSNYIVRPLDPKRDVEGINRIYRSRGMVPIDEQFLKKIYKGKFITYWVAEDTADDQIIGVSMGMDHAIAFNDPENGSSMWALAVDPQTTHPGVGMALVNHVVDHFCAKGRSFMDVSVMHDNKSAISLYESLGFHRVPVFCVKNKNAINEALFTADLPQKEKLNPYAMIIVEEAQRRGIKVEILDGVDNYFKLSYGGRSVICRESLTEMTSAIAMSRCADKSTTSRLLAEHGLKVPAQRIATIPNENQAFLQQYGKLVVKPAVGEQGAGITIDVQTKNELGSAIEYARQVDQKVILEEMVAGQDIRIIVIDFKVVAAATRKPPMVVGDGKHTIVELITKQSRRREKATQGESRIPVDEELKRTVTNAGYTLEDILPPQVELVVRRAANLHTGGTIHDITSKLHPDVISAAEQAARIINIPVVGLDFLVPELTGNQYTIIEANERPGLANHEPQPTAERFVDLLFPQSIIRHEA